MDGTIIENSDFLTIDKEYVVLSLSIRKKAKTIYLISDDGEPGYFDLRQFEIISNYLPSNWIVEYREDFDVLELLPESWVKDETFWDKFIDEKSQNAIELFEKEKKLIYEEEFKFQRQK